MAGISASDKNMNLSFMFLLTLKINSPLSDGAMKNAQMIKKNLCHFWKNITAGFLLQIIKKRSSFSELLNSWPVRAVLGREPLSKLMLGLRKKVKDYSLVA